VVARAWVLAVGGVAQAVLVTKFLFDLGVDFIHRVLFGDFEHSPAGFLGNPVEDFFAVWAFLLRITSAAAPAVCPAVTVTLLAFKKDRVDHRIGALGGLHGALKRFLAAAVHAVGKQDKGFTALLLFHDFVRGQVNGVVEQRAGPARPATARLAAARAAR